MKRLLLVYILFFFFFTLPARADDLRFGIGGGIFDTLNTFDIFTGSLTIEGRTIPVAWNLRPTLQFLAIEGGGRYLGIGILKEFYIRTNWSLGLSFSAGIAHSTKENRALTHEFEFYSRIFLSRQIDQKNAMRLEFGHISNGGLHETNPGTEPLLLFWIHYF